MEFNGVKTLDRNDGKDLFFMTYFLIYPVKYKPLTLTNN